MTSDLKNVQRTKATNLSSAMGALREVSYQQQLLVELNSCVLINCGGSFASDTLHLNKKSVGHIS